MNDFLYKKIKEERIRRLQENGMINQKETLNIEQEVITAGLPEHVAIIMDGNGRWAKQHGMERIYGHKRGVEVVKKVLEAAGVIGLKYLTLYAFSIENWNRPKVEVDALMGLMAEAIVREASELMRRNVRIKVVGNTADLPIEVWQKMESLIRDTAENTGVTLILALSYGARWEILQAVRFIAEEYKTGRLDSVDKIDVSYFANCLTTKGIPDPDLLIRTSGEYRLSNFLLWQSAYTELYFLDKFWPDFEKEDLYLAIRNFQSRERRFGKTGEQIKDIKKPDNQ